MTTESHNTLIDELSSVKADVIKAADQVPELRRLLYRVESALASARAAINELQIALPANPPAGDQREREDTTTKS
jgi:hypothetical protein